jgi:hypothetical protein
MDCKNLPPHLSLDERKEGVIYAKGRSPQPVEFKDGTIHGKRELIEGFNDAQSDLGHNDREKTSHCEDDNTYHGTFVSKIIAASGARVKISDTSLLGPHLLILCSDNSMVLFDCEGPLPDLEIRATGIVISTCRTSVDCLSVYAKSAAQIIGFHAQQVLHTTVLDQARVSFTISESTVVTYNGTKLPEIRRIFDPHFPSPTSTPAPKK